MKTISSDDQLIQELEKINSRAVKTLYRAIEEGEGIIQKHPDYDLTAMQMRLLQEEYEREASFAGAFNAMFMVIRRTYLAGIARGTRMQKASDRKNLKPVKSKTP